MRLTAKKLILGLMVADPDMAISVQAIIRACGLFNITENNVRVTLVRLSAEGMIASRGRGAYGIGPQARNTAYAVAQWHQAEQRLCPWTGDYLCVHTNVLGRSDRKALLHRERAMRMLGLRELERGLHLRPNNLLAGVDGLRRDMRALGVPKQATAFVASHFSDPQNQAISRLWDGAALNQSYRQQEQQLQHWLDGQHELEHEVAARESYLMGADAIRSLVFDPWLPEPMVDSQARHQFALTVARFDAAGKAIWNEVLKLKPAHPFTDTAAAFLASAD